MISKDGVRNALTWNGLIELLLLAVGFGIFNVLLGTISVDLSSLPGGLIVLISSLSLLLLWSIFYYRLDRNEPEPVPHIAGAVIVGGLLYHVMDSFIAESLYQLPHWKNIEPTLEPVQIIVGDVLLPVIIFQVGTWSFYRFSSYFNEYTDGLVYGAFIGMGYGLVMSLNPIWGHGYVSLYYLFVITALNLALFSSIGSLSGMYYGFMKMEPEREWTFFVRGLLLSSTLLLIYSLVSNYFQNRITLQSNFMEIVPVMVICLVIIGVNSLQIKRLALKDDAVTPPSHGDTSKFNLLYIALLSISLVIPLGFRAYTERKIEYKLSDTVTVSLPARYRDMISSEGKIVFHDHKSEEIYNPLIVMHLQQNDYLPRTGIVEVTMNEDDDLGIIKERYESMGNGNEPAKYRHRITRKLELETGQLYLTVHSVLPAKYVQQYLNTIMREIEAGVR